MSTYAIGDIQGCYEELKALLAEINFDPKQDTLWLTGDLINRGPQSLETLRFIKAMGFSVITILGNHDLHLLAVAYGQASIKSEDTIQDIINAPDKEELCNWLRQQPLLHHDPVLGYTITHAGIYPPWDLNTAKACAHEVESALKGKNYLDFFAHMYGNKPYAWHDELTSFNRLRFITNAFTRMRLYDPTGQLHFKDKGPPKTNTHYIPWFEASDRPMKNDNIIFGHWAALECKVKKPHVFALDSGCVWGNTLTALRLDDQQRFFVESKQTIRR